MLRASGQNPKSIGFTVIFLLYEVLSLVGVENLSFQTPQSACPILKTEGGCAQKPFNTCPLGLVSACPRGRLGGSAGASWGLPGPRRLLWSGS